MLSKRTTFTFFNKGSLPIVTNEVNSSGAGSNAKHKTRERINCEHSNLTALQKYEVFICKRAERRKATAKTRHQKQFEVRRKAVALEEESRENPDAKATENVRHKRRPRESGRFRNHKRKEVAKYATESTADCHVQVIHFGTFNVSDYYNENFGILSKCVMHGGHSSS